MQFVKSCFTADAISDRRGAGETRAKEENMFTPGDVISPSVSKKLDRVAAARSAFQIAASNFYESHDLQVSPPRLSEKFKKMHAAAKELYDATEAAGGVDAQLMYDPARQALVHERAVRRLLKSTREKPEIVHAAGRRAWERAFGGPETWDGGAQWSHYIAKCFAAAKVDLAAENSKIETKYAGKKDKRAAVAWFIPTSPADFVAADDSDDAEPRGHRRTTKLTAEEESSPRNALKLVLALARRCGMSVEECRRIVRASSTGDLRAISQLLPALRRGAKVVDLNTFRGRLAGRLPADLSDLAA